MEDEEQDSTPPPANFNELFERLYPNAIDCGIDVWQFWDMTLKEIRMVMESYQRKEETRAKRELAINYNLAGLVSDFVARKLNGKKLPSLYETFPALAEGISPEKQNKQREYNEAMAYKIKFMGFMTAHNAKRKGGAS